VPQAPIQPVAFDAACDVDADDAPQPASAQADRAMSKGKKV
jgi:hypothetical protein